MNLYRSRIHLQLLALSPKSPASLLVALELGTGLRGTEATLGLSVVEALVSLAEALVAVLGGLGGRLDRGGSSDRSRGECGRLGGDESRAGDGRSSDRSPGDNGSRNVRDLRNSRDFGNLFGNLRDLFRDLRNLFGDLFGDLLRNDNWAGAGASTVPDSGTRDGVALRVRVDILDEDAGSGGSVTTLRGLESPSSGDLSRSTAADLDLSAVRVDCNMVSIFIFLLTRGAGNTYTEHHGPER